MNDYSKITVESLQDYAVKAGLDGDAPADFIQMNKFLKNGMKLLEVGCGTGRLGRIFVKQFSYVGIDNNLPYLNYFRDWLDHEGYEETEEIARYQSFEEFDTKGFDAIIFSWSVIEDFDQEKQLVFIKKAVSLLNPKGIILLDNPAKGSQFNAVPGYKFNKFHFEDWKAKLAPLGLSKMKSVNYTTKTGRVRELTVLVK